MSPEESWMEAVKASAREYRVLDVHHHLGRRGRFLVEEPFDVAAAVNGHLRMMDRHGIAEACLIASHSGRLASREDWMQTNDVLVEAQALALERFRACIGTIDPATGSAGLEEIDRCVQELGFAGMAWHGRLQGTFLDSPMVRRYIERCVELGVTIFVHAYGESRLEAIWRLASLAEAYPNTNFVALDAFSTLDNAEWILEVGGRLPNVWYETGGIVSHSRPIERFVQKYGYERLIYGSTFYAAPASYVYPIPLYEVLESSIEDEAKAAILGGNARDLLHI